LAQISGIDALASLAGATSSPSQYALPMRIGGFGGVEGLSSYLIENRIDLLVVALHPYADRMWQNALEAARQTGVAMVVNHRAPWKPIDGDRWSSARDIQAAVARLQRRRSSNVFLPLGRKEISKFEAAPKHNYLVRAIEKIQPPLDLPNVTCLLARPPFSKEAEIALMLQHRVDLMIVKNSGGVDTYAKMEAARELGVETIIIRRPYSVSVAHHDTVDETMSAIVAKLDHDTKRFA
jgi:precorrin-6A/cobalt-precorrin-6A reductase